MRKMLLLLATLFIGLQVFAQTTITGTVTDTDGMGIPGANVVVKGVAGKGTITDIDGKYSLKVPAEATALVFSAVGLGAQEIEIAGQTVINTTLKVDDKEIEEVVVVAYGTAKKSTFTGSAATVDADKLERIQTSDASKALEGAVSGVTISSESGSPGSKTKIRIRGIGSIYASSEPLIIVDGSPYSGGLNTLNPADIESYSVLKDAASAALYGARGANGVVLITTKSGKKGKTVVNFDAKVGYNTRGVPEYDVIDDPATFYETFWQSMRNSYIGGAGGDMDMASKWASADLITGSGGLGYNIYNVPNDQVVLPNGKINPNAKIKFKDADWNAWDDALYGPKIRQEYNLSVSRGNEKSKVFFSLGYLDDGGYNNNTYFKRISTRLKYTGDIYDWLKFSNNTQYTHSDRNTILEGGNYSNTFSWTRNIPSIYPIYKHDKLSGDLILDPYTGEKVYDDGQVDNNVNDGARKYASMMNRVASQDEDLREYLTDILSNNMGVTVSLPFGIEFSSNMTLSREWIRSTKFQTPIIGNALSFGGRSRIEKEGLSAMNFNQIIRWNKEFSNNLDLNVMLGHESYKEDYGTLYGTKTGFLDTENTQLNNATKIEELNSYEREYRLEGYFGQVTAAFMDKYYLSFSARRDASSVFAPENRWGNFWSVGASWRVSEEDFFAGMKDILPSLKLKGSYGAQGNDYLYDADLEYRNYLPYQNQYRYKSDGNNISILNKFMGNKEITWETNLNLNVGLEFALKNDVLTGEIEFFQRTTKDMLFNMPVPASTGFKTKPVNVGDMKNTGIDVTLGSRILSTDKFKWYVSANLTHYKNEIISLPEENREKGIIRGSQRLMEGGSVYDFYMVKWGGVDKESGAPLYMLKEKEEDTEYKALTYNEKLEAISKQTLGTSLPDIQGGFSTEFEFFNFDLSAQFSYAVGGLAYDVQYSNLMNPTKSEGNWHKDVLNSWRTDNKGSDIPMLKMEARSYTTKSDRFLVDASYLSFRNITFGYSLPKEVINRLHIQYLRVYFVADNVALWSERKGFDPRMNIRGINTYAAYSPIRTMSFGLNVKF